MSREAFEAKHCGGNPHTTRRNEHGDYVLPSVQDAWSGWQSGHADAYERAAKVCETHTVDDVLISVGIARSCADMIRALAKEAKL